MHPSSPLAGRSLATGAVLAWDASKCFGRACRVALIARRHRSRAWLGGDDVAGPACATPTLILRLAEETGPATPPSRSAVFVAGKSIRAADSEEAVAAGEAKLRMLETRENRTEALRSSRHRGAADARGGPFVRRTSAWQSTMIWLVGQGSTWCDGAQCT